MVGKKSVYQRMVDIDPKRDPCFTAVEQLKRPGEMRQFLREYAAFLREHGDSEHERSNPEAVANHNVGYVIGYYDKPTPDRWKKLLPDQRV